MFAQNSAIQTVARARQYTKYYPIGYCANYVSNCVTRGQFGTGIRSAKDAWLKARYKVTTGVPPAGAPVYWNNGTWGHIAVSVGGGRVRSTDYPAPGLVGETDINTLERYFGMGPNRYLGWSRDLAGAVIPGLEPRKPAPKPTPTAPARIPAPYKYNFSSMAVRVDDEVIRPGMSNNAVRAFNATAWSWIYYNGGSDWCRRNYATWQAEPAAKFGSASGMVLRMMYHMLHARNPKAWPDYSKSSWPTYPGPLLLRQLGLRAD